MTDVEKSADVSSVGSDDLVGGNDYDDESDCICPECRGDGGDPMCDYVLPCPECGGMGLLA